jgi:hypothetical protein
MRELEGQEVEEIAVDVDGPSEIWPADKPFPEMKTDGEWDDFVSRYDFSEVFSKASLLTTSKQGRLVETRVSKNMAKAFEDAFKKPRQTRFWGEG